MSWRAMAARTVTLYDAGEVLLLKVKNLVVLGAALKILGLDPWWLVILSPAIALGYILLGAAWLKWGWWRQQNEVSVRENMDPIRRFHTVGIIRLLRERGLPLNGHEPALDEVFTPRTVERGAKHPFQRCALCYGRFWWFQRFGTMRNVSGYVHTKCMESAGLREPTTAGRAR